MLQSLHVKNLALIEEEEILFSEGLNILTGETGAGKSIILGALSLALGGKFEKDMLRDEGGDALVEAIFTVTDDATKESLKAQEVEVYDDEIILTRKISGGRAQARINGESVPAPKLAKLKDVLLDIYGQKEHHTLLKKAKHLELLDFFAKDAVAEKKERLKDAYKDYAAIEKEFAGVELSDTQREKELLFLRHEAEEIEGAALREGEDEEVEEEYRRLSNSNKIMEALGTSYGATGGEGGASEQIGRALRELSSVSEYDERIAQMEQVLIDVDGLLSDFNRDVSGYMTDAEYDGERFAEVEKRLDTINTLKGKYGPTIADVLSALKERKEQITKLEDFDRYLEDLKSRRREATERLEAVCGEVSALRQAAAKELCRQVCAVLSELNFLDVRFEMAFARADKFSSNGFDEAEFTIALNPGEPLRPLTDVASGGELSRIMLALKTVLAKGDAIDTLIFDEIDTGISGRAAQAVSQKLALVAKEHQVICITHLPQIASMADSHFLIEKHIEGDKTVSAIHSLSEEESVTELSRLLGGASITDAVTENARELKKQANDYKERQGKA